MTKQELDQVIDQCFRAVDNALDRMEHDAAEKTQYVHLSEIEEYPPEQLAVLFGYRDCNNEISKLFADSVWPWRFCEPGNEHGAHETLEEESDMERERRTR